MAQGGWDPLDLKLLMDMAAAGLGIDAICQEFKRSKTEVREIAALLRLPLEEVEYPVVCPRCGSGYVVGDEDWCPGCVLEDKVVDWEREEAEEVMLLQEIKRMDAAERKRRERRREEQGTNPRKGPWAEELREAKRNKR